MKHKKQGYQFVRLFDLKVGNIIQTYSTKLNVAPLYYVYDDTKRRMQAVCLQGSLYSDPSEIPNDRDNGYLKQKASETAIVLSINKEQITIIMQQRIETFSRHELYIIRHKIECIIGGSTCLLAKVFD